MIPAGRRRPLVVRIAVVIGGFAALLGGLVLMVLPGPGIPLVLVGFGLLAQEFRWAAAALDVVRRRTERVRPKRRETQIVVGTAAAAAAIAGMTIAYVWGVPGF